MRLEDPDSRRDPCEIRLKDPAYDMDPCSIQVWRIQIPKGILVHFGLEDPDLKRDPCSIRVRGFRFQTRSVLN
jgi:hypothetical protein